MIKNIDGIQGSQTLFYKISRAQSPEHLLITVVDKINIILKPKANEQQSSNRNLNFMLTGSKH